MRKPMFVAFCLVVLGTVVMAEEVNTKWHCAKPSENPTLKVGDVPDHSYSLAQGSCDATSSAIGEKSGAWTESQETWKASYKLHGRFNVTADNGDMIYYAYERSGVPNEKKLLDHWKIASATGKHKGITGSGTCAGTVNDDGSSDWQCTGTTASAKAAQ
jgi:hypothetical protein